MLGKRSPRVFRPATEALESRELLSGLTIEVTTAANAGPGNLRRAIKLSNLNIRASADSPNLINFAIPEFGAHSIILTKGLPEITKPVLIDGFTQPGSSRNTNPISSPDSNNAIQTVRLTAAAPIDRFVQITKIASGTTNRGLAFVSETIDVDGVRLIGTSNVSITGNNFLVVGEDRPGQFGAVVDIRAGSHNTIGGSTELPALQNVMGRYQAGVLLGHRTRDNGIIGNIIGQANALPHESRGVRIAPGSRQNDVSLNYFFANAVAIDDAGRDNVIANNTVSGR